MKSNLQRQATECGGFAELSTKLECQGFESSAARKAEAARPAAATVSETGATPPPTLRTRETGLPFNFLIELALKVVLHGGRLRLRAISDQLLLPMAVTEPLMEFLRAECLCEVACPDPDKPAADICFQLTAAGHVCAEAALQKSQYVGPAPVSLEAYVAQVERQSAAQMKVSRRELGVALSGLVVRNDLRDDLGAALNSGRPILIHGPSGSGKTFIAERLVGALSGHIYVPHAILVDGSVIQIFDPLVHRAVPASGEESLVRQLHGADRRWVLCRRPMVMAGGELTLATLDLQFDPHSRFYVAPPQVKANNGIFIIDDLGRQQVSPQDLMNRWIRPLDRRVDHFVLHSGKQFSLPFQLSVIFSSNLRPTDLADEAFLRRLGYKIYVGEMSAEEYRQIFVQACERSAVAYGEAAFKYVLDHLHATYGKPLLACTPYDLVSMVRDRAVFGDGPPALTDEALDWAWKTYFSAA